MAKQAYVGVEKVARKIKKGYIGVDGVARKIKKAYIGVNGVARPCWPSGTLKVYGSVTSLSTQAAWPGIGHSNYYAMFAGGEDYDNNDVSTVNAYDNSLTRTVTHFSSYKSISGIIGGSTPTHVFFAGGNSNSMSLYTVYGYDSTLTCSSYTDLDNKNVNTSVSTGEYTLFITGTDSYPSKVEAYSKNGKRNCTDLSYERSIGEGRATIGDYGILAGGTYRGNTVASCVDAYNSNLSRRIPSYLTKASHVSGASNEKYAIFTFGYGNSSSNLYDFVDFYDSSLTKGSISGPKNLGACGISFNEYALYITNNATYAYVYDQSLTLQTMEIPSTYQRYYHAGTTIGDYALILSWNYYTTINVGEQIMYAYTIS